MKIKRFVGKSDRFPNYYVEFFQTQTKEVISKVAFDKTTFQPLTLSKEEQEVLDGMGKSDFKSLQGEEFQAFIKGKAQYLKKFDDFCDTDEDFRFIHADILHDGFYYICMFNKEIKANVILRVSKDAKESNYTFFSKEELDYPATLYFLYKTLEKSKVHFFENVSEKESDFYALYQNEKRLYVTQVKYNKTDVVDLEVYGEDYFIKTTDKTDVKEAILVKEEIEFRAWARSMVLMAEQLKEDFQ